LFPRNPIPELTFRHHLITRCSIAGKAPGIFPE